MELRGKDLFCYQLLDGYGKNASKCDREDSIFNQWVEEIKRDALMDWNKAKEKYDIGKYSNKMVDLWNGRCNYGRKFVCN